MFPSGIDGNDNNTFTEHAMQTFRAIRITLWIPTVVLALGCGSGLGDEEIPSFPRSRVDTIIMGHAVFGHEVRAIRPCGMEKELWAIDSTQALWDVHRELAPGLDPYEEVFVVVRGRQADAPSDGFGAEYTGSIVVDRVLHAASEGFGCELDLDGFLFRISRNEPFWTIIIFETSAEMRRMEGPGGIWTELQLTTYEPAMTFEGSDDESGSLDVVVREQPCRDSMSGAYYAYRASVVVAGEELEGCALFGTGR